MRGKAALSAAGLMFLLCAAAWGQVPRTKDGHPDLQGVWSTATITPLERPAALAGKEFFTAKEADDYEKTFLQNNNRDRRDGGSIADVSRAYNESWYDSGTKVVSTRRTSLITDPPDGRIPALTPEAQKKQRARAELLRRPAEGPEDRNLMERCIARPGSGPPILPGAYNNNYLILQTPENVTLLTEMIHNVRVFPLDGRPHLPADVRLWMGDSRGGWEGDTLVVETTNFRDLTPLANGDGRLRVVERFRRTGADTLLYQFTVDDPTAFTKSWSGEVPMTRAPGPIYEYACHEGNYGMVGILAGARADEKAAKGESR